MRISVRLQKKLVEYKNGIDYALWYFFVKNKLSVNLNKLEKISKQKLSNGVNIKFCNKHSELYLNELVKEHKKTKSEIIRFCLFWLMDTLGKDKYPVNFKEK